MSPDTFAMAEAIKNGIDNNSTDAPAMSIDPKSQQVSVVGDPNRVNETNGDYSIKFIYPEDILSDEDKEKMKKNEDGEYEAIMRYSGKRVKPLHRTKIAMHIANILTKAGTILEDGSYTSDTINEKTVQVFLDNIDVIADMARMVLDIPEAQVGFIDSYSLVDFFVQMLGNEPNVIKESAGFLEPSLVRQLMEAMTTESEPTKEESNQANTQQN